MTITWLGQACFKIETGVTTIIIDPYDAKVGFALPQCSADLVLMTHGHFDHANSAAFPDAKRIITEPGEYQFDEIKIKGISTFHDAVQGAMRGLNTMYAIRAEGLCLLHMGDFGEMEMRPETLQEVGAVDILMIPVGGTYTIDGAQAAMVARQILPKIIIPMHYLTPGLTIPLAGPEVFLESIEARETMSQEQLSITQETIVGKHEEVVVLVRRQE